MACCLPLGIAADALSCINTDKGLRMLNGGGPEWWSGSEKTVYFAERNSSVAVALPLWAQSHVIFPDALSLAVAVTGGRHNGALHDGLYATHVAH